MVEYFLIDNKRLVKGDHHREYPSFVENAFEFKRNQWINIDINDINDRLIGYNPDEEDILCKIGNTEILDSIKRISKDEAIEIMKKTLY